MADRTAIEWAEATWNPIRGNQGLWHCTKVSPGCQHCYAERLNIRRGGPAYTVGADTLRLNEEILSQPLRWRRPRRIFVCSMTDLFADVVPDAWVLSVFGIMAAARPHQMLVLTKRHKRMHRLLTDDRFIDAVDERMAMLTHAEFEWPLPNLWLGVSAEDQHRANERIPILLRTPAAVRWISLEPLLGPIQLTGICSTRACFNALLPGRYPGLDWIVVGGESGGPPDRALVQLQPTEGRRRAGNYWIKSHAYRWVRSLQYQCIEASVPFFFKQWGGPTPKSGGRLLDGRLWSEYPLT